MLSKYPEHIQQAALKQIIIDMYKGSLYKTAKDLCGYSNMTWHTHGKVIEAIEEDTERKLIIMPRGTFKSSICSVAAPIWWLIRNANERILLDSEVYTNSKNFLREIKGHLSGSKFRSIFGDWTTGTWNEGEITIAPRTAILKEASITCGGIETVKVGQHYTKIVGDDYNSRNNSETPEGREKVLNHYRMNTAILEPHGAYLIVGTRYAVNDVPGHIMANEIGEAA